jgi:hypothetical protein
VNFPSTSVATPRDVPTIETDTPITGSWVAELITAPVILLVEFWLRTDDGEKKVDAKMKLRNEVSLTIRQGRFITRIIERE